MNAVVLDAASAEDGRTRAAADEMVAALEARGAVVERVTVRDLDIRPCVGCFGCWTRTPGQCVIDDDARAIAEKVIASDVYAIVTPVTFGSLGSLAKRVQDRLICLILPYFKMIGGEIHHSARYRRYPALLVLGTQATANAEQAVLIARLVERNAVNLHCPAHGAAVVVGDGQARSEAEQLLDTIGVREEVAA